MATTACRNDLLHDDGSPDRLPMIAVDTSALMAIALGEAEADACASVLEAQSEVVISAATLAEARIVAARRDVAEELAGLVDSLGFEVVSVTAAVAARVAEAYARWGKGANRAALNFGDCFAYEVARTHDCPLLFVGEDFKRTDLKSALDLRP